jgi:hypothetical protein
MKYSLYVRSFRFQADSPVTKEMRSLLEAPTTVLVAQPHPARFVFTIDLMFCRAILEKRSYSAEDISSRPSGNKSARVLRLLK